MTNEVLTPRKKVAGQLSKLSFSEDSQENEVPQKSFLEQTTDTLSNDTVDKENVQKKTGDSLSTPVKNDRNVLVNEVEEEEPILKENPRRFVLFPIQFHKVCFPFPDRWS